MIKDNNISATVYRSTTVHAMIKVYEYYTTAVVVQAFTNNGWLTADVTLGLGALSLSLSLAIRSCTHFESKKHQYTIQKEGSMPSTDGRPSYLSCISFFILRQRGKNKIRC